MLPYRLELIYPRNTFKILDVNRQGNILYHSNYFVEGPPKVIVRKGNNDYKLTDNVGTFKWAFDGALILHSFNGNVTFYDSFGKKVGSPIRIPNQSVIDIFPDKIMVHDMSSLDFDSLEIRYDGRLNVKNVKVMIQYPENHCRRLTHFTDLNNVSRKLHDYYQQTIFARQRNLSRLLTNLGLPANLLSDLSFFRHSYEHLKMIGLKDVIFTMLPGGSGYSSDQKQLIAQYIQTPIQKDEKGTYLEIGIGKFVIYMIFSSI